MKTRTRLGGRIGMLAGFLLAAGLWAARTSADTIYWDGAIAGWDDVANWSTVSNATTPNPAAIPGANDTAYFSIDGDLGATAYLNGDQAAYGIVFREPGNNYIKLEGGGTDRTLTIGPGGIASLSWNNTIGSATAGQNVNVQLNGSQTWRLDQTGGSILYVRNAISRKASDTSNRTLLLDVGNDFQPTINLYGDISNGGASGSLAVWLTGFGIHNWSGVNTHTGGTVINGGRVNLTPTSMPASGPLVLRGSRRRDGGIILTGASATFTHTDVRLASGVNSMTMDATSTFNMGTINRTGGVISLAALAGQTYNVGNANVNGILGPWAILGSGTQYLRNNGSGVIEGLPVPAATTESSWTDPTANYGIDNNVNLTVDRTVNTILASDGWSRTINLGSSGDNDLTLNGLTAINGNWTISRSGSSTGKLIIGDTEEIVVTGSAGFTCSAPIVDGGGGPGRLTLAPMAGVVTLSGDNTYSGGTVFSPASENPTLNINSATALGTGAFYLFNNTGGTSANRVLAAIDNTTASDITLANNNAQFWNGDFRFVGTRSLNMGTGAVSLGETPGLNATRTVEVVANTNTVGGTISDGTHASYPVTSLAKTGAGTLELTGVSTYSGATTVSAGTLKLGASASLTSTNITVAGAATLHLTGSETLHDTATALSLSTGAGTVLLDTGVEEVIGQLWLDGAQAADGTYGSTSSSAPNQSDAFFSGTGVLIVGLPPPPAGTVITIR